MAVKGLNQHLQRKRKVGSTEWRGEERANLMRGVVLWSLLLQNPGSTGRENAGETGFSTSLAFDQQTQGRLNFKSLVRKP